MSNRFGRLTAGAKVMRGGRCYFECVCDCGTRKQVRKEALVSGKTVSCGCILRTYVTLTLQPWFGEWLEEYAERIVEPDEEFITFMLHCAIQISSGPS